MPIASRTRSRSEVEAQYCDLLVKFILVQALLPSQVVAAIPKRNAFCFKKRPSSALRASPSRADAESRSRSGLATESHDTKYATVVQDV